MAAGAGDRLYNGLFYSYPTGRCHHRRAGQSHSGTKNIVAIWTLAGEGEVFGKEGDQQVQKNFAKACYTVRRKGLATNHFTTNLQRGVTAMKKSTIVIRFLVVLMMIAAFVACASTPTRESSGQFIDDSVITTKIKTQLANDDFLKSFQISVESRKGIVQLSGFVDSQKAVDKAGQIARGVDGVKSLKNDLIVK
jgi:hypothetical protein